MPHKGQVYKRRKSKLKPLSEAQKGYIAGLLDGEGHLYIRGEYEGACYSRIRIRITEESVVKFLVKITGIKNVCSHMPSQRRKDGGFKKRVYEWQVGNREDVRQLLINVMPYLIIKADHAKWILEFESLKDQGVGNGAAVRDLIDKISAKQTHLIPKRTGREQLRYGLSKSGKTLTVYGYKK